MRGVGTVARAELTLSVNAVRIVKIKRITNVAYADFRVKKVLSLNSHERDLNPQTKFYRLACFQPDKCFALLAKIRHRLELKCESGRLNLTPPRLLTHLETIFRLQTESFYARHANDSDDKLDRPRGHRLARGGPEP